MPENIRPGIKAYAPPASLDAHEVEIATWAWRVACRLEVADCQWIRHWLSPVPFALQWLADDPLGVDPISGADRSRHESTHGALNRWCADEARARQREQKKRSYRWGWSDPGDGADSSRGNQGGQAGKKRPRGKPGSQRDLF